MRVDKTGTNRTESAKAKKGAQKGEDSGFSRELGGGQQAGGNSGITGSQPVSGVDALLSLQEVGDATTGAGKSYQRGENLLDRLEELRDYLLLGAIPKHKLERMADILGQGRERSDDENLEQVVDEIELRVQVELAKYHAQNG